MKIQLDGKVVYLEFRHLCNHKRIPYATECVVLTQADAREQTDYNQHNPKYVLALADSACHEKDQFDRSIGRRLALTRALMGYKPRTPRFTMNEAGELVSNWKTPFTRNQRAQIWQQYHQRNSLPIK
jgi:hypothetical protein